MTRIELTAPGGLENLRVRESGAHLAVGPHDVLVRVRASSLNYHDLGVALTPRTSEVPLVPLSDGAGTVEAVGAQVTSFAVGDNVLSTFFPTWLDGPATIGDFATTPGDGVDGFATEHVVAHEHAFTRTPQGWSHQEAATLTTAGVSAWRALFVNGNLQPGETVLVLGTGGVSIYALQLAHAVGARVIVTSSSDEKLRRARELGAWHTINYATTPAWSAEVLKLTEGRGVDHVIEVGGLGTMEQSIRSVRVGGHIALIGVLTGLSDGVNIYGALKKQARIQGLLVGSRRNQIDLVHAVEALGIRPVIDSTFPLDQLAEAFAHQKAGKHFGKIAIDI
jgi:NADPH:quinone reductase-like Zn-dependent oxidoreductase